MERPTVFAPRLRAYELATVEQFLEAAAQERRGLEAALAAANARIESARDVLSGTRDLRQRLGAMVSEAERRHAELEAETARVIAEVRAVADAEAEVCVSSARAEVARRDLAVRVRHLTDLRPPTPFELIDLDRRRAADMS